MSEFSEKESMLESQSAPPQMNLISKVWDDFTLETRQDGTRKAIRRIKGCPRHPLQDLQQSLARELETFKFDKDISHKALAKMIIVQ
ncbi:hypothetical protein AMTRI_Chr12g269820 [Amborella trichopoda]